MKKSLFVLPYMVSILFLMAWRADAARAQTYPVFYSGAQISKLCLNNSPACSAYVAAVTDYGYESGLYAVAEGHGTSATACIRWGYPLTKMVAMIRSFILQNPNVAKMQSGFDVVDEAISESFPC
jgi:hypothetical protein